MVVAQQGDGRLGSGFVLHHNVLQCAAQRSLNGNLAPGSTFRMVDTGPRMPRRRRAPAARMTARTEFW